MKGLGLALPLAHFPPTVRAVMLKGAGAGDPCSEVAAITALMAAMGTIALLRYRQTIDRAGSACGSAQRGGRAGSTASRFARE